jgi:hypothetical protein
MALGCTLDRIITIDSDLGLSGTSAVDREGFQRLVAEVGVGKAGIWKSPAWHATRRIGIGCRRCVP